MNKRDKNGLLNSIDALTDIDDALLSEVFSARRKRGRFARNIIAAAAALLVIVGAILIITNLPADDGGRYTVELPTGKPHETALPTEMVTESAEPTQVIYTADPTQVTGTVDPVMTAAPTQKAYTADPAQATENALNTPNATSKATAKPTAVPTAAPTAKPTESTPQFPEEFMRVNVDGRSYAVHQQLNYAKTYIEGSGFLHADGFPASILVHDENFISKLPAIPLGRNMRLVPMNGCKISSGIAVYDLASREYLGGGLTVDGLRSAARSSTDGVIAFASASCTGRYIPELDDNETRGDYCCFILKP
ncbi:MAG: hypothetical protein IKX58_04105 [Clostridia bacterium]|nr:hypothetical protein [Clostridia bacterium]